VRRLAHGGEHIDRTKPLTFRFQGRRYGGFEGDTIASALAGNGVRVLSRSFKYHRPRGIMSLAGCEANTLVEVNRVPNVFAERHRVSDGEAVRAQNYLGSLRFDLHAWTGAFDRFLPAGFYYRAFFRPKGAWRFWEPVIRHMAGIGRVDVESKHGYFDKSYLFADVAVIGGGPAGMSAALAAAQDGSRVIIVDHNRALGGALNYARFDAGGGLQGRKERDRLLGALASAAALTVLTGASCEGLFADHLLAIVQGRRLHKLRAGRVVLATGALEQPSVFRNNDLPGIMLGSAAQKLLKLYGVCPGERAVVLTANDHGFGVALDLADAGIDVAAVLDTRAMPPDDPLRRAVINRELRVEAGATVCEALGRQHVRAVRVCRVRAKGEFASPFDTIACDLVCVSIGFAPNLALAAHAGARLVYDQRTAMHRAEELPEGITLAGSASQCFPLDAALAQGERAGKGNLPQTSATIGNGAAGVTHPLPFCFHPKGKEFVDFDEDLTAKDIRDTIAAGFDHIQLLKRYSTAGMGPSQGRHSAVNTIRLAALARGLSEEQIGTTTARPPYSGESFGVLAGRSFDPIRRTPMHHRHLEAGAQMMVAGAWLRPAYYGEPRDAANAIAAEVASVRSGVGLIDVSTLGKIETRGPDAAEFLNRIYFTPHLKQPLRRGRYGLMTDASGAVIDDGVICRLADEHFYVTATTSGVEGVVRSMYFWNAQWQLDIDITHVTAAYAAVNLAGPQCRAVLSELCKDVDLGPDAFPYMGVRAGHVADVPARLLRVGFVGELGYEIHLPASYGEFVWDRMLAAGARWGIRPFGVEAQRILRLEKGHVIIGQDTDGLTNPTEIGMGAGASSKTFFLGRAALQAHLKRGTDRKLVGFVLEGNEAIAKESHLVIEAGEIAGRVTSCAYSAALKRVIGLAYVRPQKSQPGQTFSIRVDGGKLVTAQVASLPFYDPANERQKS
jgi:sarcosine oxidase subunit alpha